MSTESHTRSGSQLNRPGRTSSVALLDLAGDPSTPRRLAIDGTVEGGAGAYSGIRLTVGVPFELNHANPLAAAAPLDRGEMFWSWQSGHKFLRADLARCGSRVVVPSRQHGLQLRLGVASASAAVRAAQ